MEKIDLHNYEAWFLDYSEKSLSESQVSELNVFLGKHPELKQQLEEFESVMLHDNAAQSAGESFKANLLREESTGLTRVEYLMIAEVEGNISKDEKEELAGFVANQPFFVKELAIYHKAKLSNKEAIIFAGKSDLIQKEGKVITWWTYASTVAAAAVIALVLWNTNTYNEAYSPRGFVWEPGQEKVEEKRSNGIVAVEELEFGKNIKKLPFYSKASQFAQEKSVKNPDASNTLEKPEILTVIEPLEDENLAEQSNSIPFEEQEAAEISVKAEPHFNDALAEAKPIETKQVFVPIQKFAKDKIKKDLLKGKTFSETIAEEIAEISNDKITFEVNKEEGGLFESFALNLGKLSISRNK
ncbi:MAG: hypothetical protein ACJAV5_001556 [Vicingaceae bacterium]|jgi:hypothetical protein